MKTAVRISDLSGIETKVYIAENENECLDKTDLDVYRTVIRFGAVITMGKVIGEPIYLSEYDGRGCEQEEKDEKFDAQV